jgi:signal transduction histidine kinase
MHAAKKSPDIDGACGDVIDITHALNNRPSRVPDYQAERSALTAIAAAMASSPEDVLRNLAQSLLDLCKADAAGVSIWDDEGSGSTLDRRANPRRYVVGRSTATTSRPDPGSMMVHQISLMLLASGERFSTSRHEPSPPAGEALFCPFAVASKVIGTVWVSVDDTQPRFEMEDARLLGNLALVASTRYQAQLALEVERHMDLFLGMTAHELRTPLSSMLNAVECLRHSDHDPHGRERATVLLARQIAVMAVIVDGLLDFPRARNGTLEVRSQRVELVRVLGHAIDTCRPLMLASKHAFVANLPPGEIWLDADPGRLVQVFNNLLINAAKYTDQGGRIELSATASNAECVVRVRDTGIGIAPENLSRIFDPYVQVHGSKDRSLGGLGIGLALVRALARAHGGEVEAHSAGLGQGSEFVVRLPAAARTD